MNTVALDLKNATNNGQLLWQWLGGFWHRVYQNPDFAKEVEYGQGLLSVQLYLDFVESISKINRYTVPVFHRERWKPVYIRKSQANTGSASFMTIGMDPPTVIGPQLTSDYGYDETFQIGGTAPLSAVVSYPLADTQISMASVCNSILNPASVLIANVDFTVKDSTVFFLREKDPFSDSAFPKRKITGIDGAEDQELVLWCMDSLEDQDYVYNQLGYIFGVKLDSSEFYQVMMNALWDLYNFGTPVQRLKVAFGAILQEPTVIGDEVVVKILDNQVITDQNVYTLSSTATLRPAVVEGASLSAGDFLTETVRFYSNINPQQLGANGEYGIRLKTDVPSMFFGPDMFRSKLTFGVGASWDMSDIVSAGNDLNGNPKLKFDLFGDAEDISTFWSDFWNYLEINGISSLDCFTDYLDPEPGTTYGRVAPLEYFLRYFLRPNLFVVVVDANKLVGSGSHIDQLALLKTVLPAHVLMMITVRKDVSETPYDMTTLVETLTSSVAVVKSDVARPGGPSSLTLTYRDRSPILCWIPTCR